MRSNDWSNIGQGRGYADPADAVRAETGEYSDPGRSMPVESKLPLVSFPKGPGPMPFAMVRRAGGMRGE
jgi:hypothetical protein